MYFTMSNIVVQKTAHVGRLFVKKSWFELIIDQKQTFGSFQTLCGGLEDFLGVVNIH